MTVLILGDFGGSCQVYFTFANGLLIQPRRAARGKSEKNIISMSEIDKTSDPHVIQIDAGGRARIP